LKNILSNRGTAYLSPEETEKRLAISPLKFRKMRLVASATVRKQQLLVCHLTRIFFNDTAFVFDEC
jgi:hypothetical protein